LQGFEEFEMFEGFEEFEMFEMFEEFEMFEGFEEFEMFEGFEEFEMFEGFEEFEEFSKPETRNPSNPKLFKPETLQTRNPSNLLPYRFPHEIPHRKSCLQIITAGITINIKYFTSKKQSGNKL